MHNRYPKPERVVLVYYVWYKTLAHETHTSSFDAAGIWIWNTLVEKQFMLYKLLKVADSWFVNTSFLTLFYTSNEKGHLTGLNVFIIRNNFKYIYIFKLVTL